MVKGNRIVLMRPNNFEQKLHQVANTEYIMNKISVLDKSYDSK